MPIVCISVRMRTLYIRAGFGVAVWMKRQYQSLKKRNSNSAVPLFVNETLKLRPQQKQGINI